ncbi:MAG: ABC transporter ATP-binding protein [Anaerolineae bacterium]
MIEVVDCSKTYASHRAQPDIEALDTVNLTVADHEVLVLLGPSGCGKTTLLKIVSGLLTPDTGHVHINGQRVQGLGPDRAMVFQDYCLLPWADVLTNVAFGLEMRGVPKAERLRIAGEWVQAVGLAGFAHNLPGELSGGMQQRVGLARALAVNPRILLLDEPFGSVDAQTRRVLQEDLLALHERERKTMLFVTHSMDEAVLMGDRIVLFSPRPGRIVESVEVPFGRPRPPDVRRLHLFADLTEYLWSRLRAMRGPAEGAAEGAADG